MCTYRHAVTRRIALNLYPFALYCAPSMCCSQQLLHQWKCVVSPDCSACYGVCTCLWVWSLGVRPSAIHWDLLSMSDILEQVSLEAKQLFLMCEVDGRWERGEVRNSRESWCGGSRRRSLNKWRFDEMRVGFAIGDSDWCRSRNGSIDDDGAVFLLIRTAGDWLGNVLRHVGLNQIRKR